MPKRKAAIAGDENRKKAKTGDNFSIDKFNLSWTTHGTVKDGIGKLMVLDGEVQGCSKIAAFDIDYTIIKTKSGRTFATGPADWTWLYSCIPEQLRNLDKDGYRIVFFTNQAGIEKKKVTPSGFMTKVNNITTQLDIPVITLACTGQNEFRKPSTNMWDYFVKNCNKDVEVDLSQSVYVGDAAGRAKNWKPDTSKDFSCSDRMFAANIGIDFKTPEEFFHKEAAAAFSWGSLDPVQLIDDNSKNTAKETFHSKDLELVLMVGPPASGKSSFSKRHLQPHGYTLVNRDTLGTPAKCLKAVQSALEDGKSAVVDNTNPSKAVRAEYFDIANNIGCQVRCFNMKTPLNVAHHLNYVRVTQTDGKVRRIPDVAYNVYKKKFEEPHASEGFKEIKEINFVPTFNNKKDEKIFKQWTTGGH